MVTDPRGQPSEFEDARLARTLDGASSRTAAAKAGAWSGVDLISRQAVTLIVSIILARLLTPSDFGAVAIAAFFSMFLIGLVQSGFATAVIQRHEASDRDASSIFWWNMIASIVAASLLVAVRLAVARFFALPILAALMLAAAAQVVLTGAGAVHAALLARELKFAAIAKAGIPAAGLSGAVGVTLAYCGGGVWALAGQLVSAAALNSVGLWLVSGWRPKLVLRSEGLPDALHFARWISLSAGLEVLYTQGAALMLGKLYGSRDLGLYTRAYATQQVPAGAINGIIGRVVLPLMTRRQRDLEAMRRGLLTANRIAMLLTLPALVGLALTSDLAIRVLYGEQWLRASPVLAILALAGAFYPLHANNLQLLLAGGRSRTFFAVETAKKVVGLLSVVIGSWFGIIGLAWSSLSFSVIALLINCWPSQHYFRCGVIAQIADLRGIIAAAVAMAASVVAVRQLLHAAPDIELAVCVLVGTAVYGAAGLLLRVDAYREAVDIFKSLTKAQRRR